MMFLFIVLCFLVNMTLGRECADIYTCAECIEIEQCGWCSQLKNSKPEDLESRCLLQNQLEQQCEVGHIENPKNSMKVIKDVPVFESRDGSTVQLQPQRISLELRVGSKQTVEFKFKKAHDYPIDLYYLLDFSRSMQKYKDNLSTLGVSLSTAMGKLTSSLQMGFGSFVDKVALPFTNTNPDFLRNPCRGCVTPYSFKNHMPLSKNTSDFSEKVKQAAMSINSDTPEGGLDGLLQVMVCPEQIKWRAHSQRIVVFCTDAAFHIAGDGKLAGVVEPHDGKCHLDKNGEYTHALELDYPSISLINAKAKEHYMNIIFAVTRDAFKDYELLKNAIEGSSVGVLKLESDIINLVLEMYKKLSVSVELKHNATGSVKVAFASQCPPQHQWSDTSSCSAFKGGDEAKFRATIMAEDCSVPNQIIEIKPIGMAESLLVELKVHCDCQCDQADHHSYVEASPICKKGGDLSCGRCLCDETHHGRRCECLRQDHERSNLGSSEGCRRGNEICSGRGICECGRCVCEQPPNPQWHVGGDFCECDNFTCPSFCSGQGLCICGKCLCDADWGGSACDCPLDKRACKDPNGADDAICSGRGDCQCGICHCNVIGDTGKKYKGTYCEVCTDCKVDCTEEILACIECLANNKTSENDKCGHCEAMFPNTTIYMENEEKGDLPSASEVNNKTEGATFVCQPLESRTSLNSAECPYQFIPLYQNGAFWKLAPIKVCPEAINVIAIASGVAGSTVLAGLILLLIWKVVTTVHDKREFEKFEKQRAETKWGKSENPLYVQAQTTHVNPMFTDDTKTTSL